MSIETGPAFLLKVGAGAARPRAGSAGPKDPPEPDAGLARHQAHEQVQRHLQPPLTGPGLEGEPLDLRRLAGRAVLLDCDEDGETTYHFEMAILEMDLPPAAAVASPSPAPSQPPDINLTRIRGGQCAV